MDAYDRALRLLSIREHTEKELRAKLSERECTSDDIDNAIFRLKEEGSLSEKRFAESFIRSRLRKNPEGKSILRMRLKEKGTPSQIADEALSEAWDTGIYLKPLSLYLGSLIRRKGREGARIALLRKGFRENEIREALSLLDSDLSE